MPDLVPQPSRMIPPVPVQRPASAMTMACFGALALCLGIWSLHCLGWLSFLSVLKILVIAGNTLMVGYGIQLIRYYKGLNLPPLTPPGKIMAWLFWGIVALFILQVVWQQEHIVVRILSIPVILEAVFAFTNFLIAREDFRQREVVVLQTVIHGLGVMLLLAVFFWGIDCYLTGVLGKVAFLEKFPELLRDFILFCVGKMTVQWTLLLALLMLSAAYGLRLRLFSIQGKTPVVELFHYGAWRAVALFLVSVCLCAYTRHSLTERQRRAVAAWEEFSGEPLEPPVLEPSAEAKAFALRQKDLGLLLVSLADQQEEKDAPYAWGNFSQQALQAPPHRWYPAETGADAEDRAALSEYRHALAPAWAALDALEDVLPEDQEAAVAEGTFFCEEWRFLAAAECGEWELAQESLRRYGNLARHEFQTPNFARRLKAVRALRTWVEMLRRLPETALAEWRPEVRELIPFLEEMPDQEALAQSACVLHRCLQKLLSPQGAGFQNWGMAMPYFEMHVRLEECLLMERFAGRKRHDELFHTRDEPYLYLSGIVYIIAQDYAGELETLLARLTELAE